MKNAKKALKWISALLNQNNVPFQIVGGLAAKAYGAQRELVDIDMYVPGKDFKRVCRLVKEHTVCGPLIQKDEYWNCEYVKLTFAGQNIEIGNANNTKIFDKQKNEWSTEKINFTLSELKTLFGIRVPVIPKQNLMNYKKKLGREVDLLDIEQLKKKR